MADALKQLALYRDKFGVLRGTIMFLTGLSSDEIDELGGVSSDE